VVCLLPADGESLALALLLAFLGTEEGEDGAEEAENEEGEQADGEAEEAGEGELGVGG
jgi:hypothetical protein